MTTVLVAISRSLPTAAVLASVAIAACSGPPSVSPLPTPDPFAEARARAEQHFQRGRTYFEQGQYQSALAEFDRAYVNDPDRRDDILEMLRHTLDHLGESPEARPTAASAPPSPPKMLVAPADRQLSVPVGATPAAPVLPQPGGAALVSRYYDGQARFSLGLPGGWQRDDAATAISGLPRPLASFRDRDGRAVFEVAVDRAPETSLELYSAKLELRLQTQPAYSSEGGMIATVAGRPAFLRQVAWSTAADRTRLIRWRGLQVVVGRGEEVFVLTGMAADNAYEEQSGNLNAIIESFRLE